MDFKMMEWEGGRMSLEDVEEVYWVCLGEFKCKKEVCGIISPEPGKSTNLCTQH